MTETPSLRRRITLAVLALLASVLLILGVAIDVLFGAQVRHDLHDRLMAAATRADALAEAGTAPEVLALELNGGSIRALVVTADGATYGDPAISPETAAGPGRVLPPPPRPPRPGPGGDRADQVRRGSLERLPTRPTPWSCTPCPPGVG